MHLKRSKTRKILATILTFSMILGLFAGIPMVASAATATIDVSTLGGSDDSSPAGDAAWEYIESNKRLTLMESDGTYTLTDTNYDLNIYCQTGTTGITLILEDVDVTTPSEFFYGGTVSTIELTGTNKLTSSSYRATTVNEMMDLTITSSTAGTLALQAGGTSQGVYVGVGASLNITGDASVTVDGYTGIQAGDDYLINVGTNAKLDVTGNTIQGLQLSNTGTLNVDGEANFTGASLGGISGYYVTITGEGALSATGVGSSVGISYNTLEIKDCNVTAAGSAGALGSANAILMNDKAMLTLVNNATSAENHTFQASSTAGTHQWKLTNVTIASGGSVNDTSIYASVASSSTGTVEREPIPPTAPTITTDPSDSMIDVGDDTTFTVEASGYPAPTYQWQVSTDDGVTWTDVTNGGIYSGATTATLTLTGVTAAYFDNQYRCVATNTEGTDTSDPAVLEAIPHTAPVITTDPSNRAVAAGGNTTFTVEASGYPEPTYQWQVSTDNGSTWNNVTNAGIYSGADTDTLTLTGVTAAYNGYQYHCVATNDAGNDTSDDATLITGADISGDFTDPNFLDAVYDLLDDLYGKPYGDPIFASELEGINDLGKSGWGPMQDWNIESLAGIQHFVDLEYLNVGHNNLTSLPANLPSGLKELRCNFNPLTTLPATLPAGLELLWCNNTLVTSIAGLPAGLKDLRCYGNDELITLNISSLTALESAEIGSNYQLTTINASGCTALEYLDVFYCDELTTLNLSGCNSLEELYVNNCYELTTLNLSGLSSLEYLDVYECYKLTTLNLSGCTALEELYVNYCNELPTLDLNGITSLEYLGVEYCDKITTLNVSGNTSLVALYASYNALTSVNLTGCTDLEYIRLSYNKLTTLQDLSGMTNLDTLIVSGNRLSALPDLPSSLRRLYCTENSLTALDLSVYTNLEILMCQYNNLTTLVFPTSLLRVACHANELTGLDVTGLTGLTMLYCDLNFMAADTDVLGITALSAFTDWITDTGNFRFYDQRVAGLYDSDDIAAINALIDAKGLNWSKAPADGSFIPSSWDVDCSSDATGKRVTGLYLNGYNLTGALNVGGLTALEYLDAGHNNLTSVNLTGCNNLEYLSLSNNDFTTVPNLSGFPLTNLYLQGNQLTALPALPTTLTRFMCQGNMLTTINVSSLTNLETLYCQRNQLTSLTLSTSLKDIQCWDNKLTSLDVTGLTDLWRLYCYGNNMRTGGVSDPSLVTGITDATTFVAWGTGSFWFDYQNTTPLTYTTSTSYNVPSGRIDTAVTMINLAAGVSGGEPPYTFTKVTGPAWLVVAADGKITGTRPSLAEPATTAKIFAVDDIGEEVIITINVGAVTTGSSSSSSGGGGGGGSSETTTIPAGDGTVSVTYSQQGSAVTLDLPSTKVTEIIGKAKNGVATFDLSKVTGATNAIMSKTALTSLANAGLAVEMKLPQGTVTLDKDAAASIAKQANGVNVTIALNAVTQSSLTPAQRAAINPSDLVFNITVMSGSQVITNFDGTITVTVPYTGQLPVAVWYLNAAGELEKLVSTYDAATKTVTFTTNHLSLYVVGYDTAPPEEITIQINLTVGSTTYTVNGETKTMDAAPAITNGRTLVPLRFIAEALGADVDYDDASKTITIQLDGDTITLTIGELLPGMDVPAEITDGRTVVPLRYISETLGCEVGWEPMTKAIEITK